MSNFENVPASYTYYFCIEHTFYSSVRCIFCTNRLELSAKREEANYTTISLGSFTSNIQGRQMRDPLRERAEERFFEKGRLEAGVSYNIDKVRNERTKMRRSCGC